MPLTITRTKNNSNGFCKRLCEWHYIRSRFPVCAKLKTTIIEAKIAWILLIRDELFAFNKCVKRQINETFPKPKANLLRFRGW
jgi:hypothetical protein